jgi:hypothetical protein
VAPPLSAGLRVLSRRQTLAVAAPFFRVSTPAVRLPESFRGGCSFGVGKSNLSRAASNYNGLNGLLRTLGEHIVKSVQAFGFKGKPLCCHQGTLGKNVAIGGTVHQLDSFAGPGELHRVFTNDVAPA